MEERAIDEQAGYFEFIDPCVKLENKVKAIKMKGFGKKSQRRKAK